MEGAGKEIRFPIHSVGKRKTSVARVWLKPGEGKITVNSLNWFYRVLLRRLQREEETQGYGLAGARLGGDTQVATRQLGVQNRLLDGGKLLEPGFAQGGAETRGGLL